MSKQQFSAAEREAIWIAHERKCAYTRELIDVSSFHIDHIIPESLAEKPAEFAQIRAQLGLPDQFDLFGFENLLPCTPGTNLQKGTLIFEPAASHFFLTIAASKKSTIEKNVKAINKRLEKGRALIVLQQFLELGKLSPQEVASLLDQHSDTPGEVFRLIERMKFLDQSEVAAISKANIQELKDRPVKLGLNDHLEGLALRNDKNEEIIVRTCREYETSLQRGFYAYTTFDIKMSAFFEHQCGLLSALEEATTPIHSFIAEPQVGITDLHLLPYSLFPQFGAVESEENSGVTLSYQDKVDEGSLLVRSVKHNALRVEEVDGMGQQLIEVVRADFNNDGVEDILLFEYCYAIQGTLGYGGIVGLTRKAVDVPFEVITLKCAY